MIYYCIPQLVKFYSSRVNKLKICPFTIIIICFMLNTTQNYTGIINILYTTAVLSS